MIKLIKTIIKNGETKKFTVLAESKEQAEKLLLDSRFSLEESPEKPIEESPEKPRKVKK